MNNKLEMVLITISLETSPFFQIKHVFDYIFVKYFLYSLTIVANSKNAKD